MVSLQLIDDRYVALDEDGSVVGRIDAEGRFPIGGGSEFFLAMEQAELVSFDSIALFDSHGGGRASKEIGRYNLGDRVLLALGSDFFVIRDGRWIVVVDKKCSGIARDLTDDEFLGVESTLINIPKNVRQDLLAFRHGEWVLLYDRELNHLSRRRL